MENITSVLSGMAFGLSLIIAIGPQNIFVLKQGLSRKHVGVVVLICVISDSVLIALGAGGMGAALRAHPGLIEIVRYSGAIFLIVYGAVALIRAIKPHDKNIIRTAKPHSLSKVIMTCLAFTWLNPHVYIDTALLLGTAANTPGQNTLVFAIGAISGSIIWFTGLGYGARFLTPLFTKPKAGRVLDFLVSGLMFSVAVVLLVG